MRGNKELSTYKVLLRMCAKREEQSNPMEYLHGDWEQYFHVLKEWKKACEKDFLEKRPHLREPKSKKKIFINLFFYFKLRLVAFVIIYYTLYLNFCFSVLIKF